VVWVVGGDELVRVCDCASHLRKECLAQEGGLCEKELNKFEPVSKQDQRDRLREALELKLR
jgi:hypothetical protein